MKRKHRTPRSQPDVLLVVLDTLRADRLSCYGYPRETSPHLDAFAEDAVIFERAVSPAQWTIPAHASIFTGEYPTTHMTNQIYDKHSPDQPLLAELLNQEGYRTVSFCNNPLLGVVENDLDRGFEEVYNYGGALPNRPAAADSRPRIVGRMMHHLGRLLGRVTTPIQDLFARNDWLLNMALHPRIVNLWHANLNFKGNTVLSIRDLLGTLRTHRRRRGERPLFTFVNLMETHLPYRPPQRFIQRFAPYYRNDRQARDFMERYNLEHYRWMIPLEEPLGEVQDRVLNDLYDAEIAYQDYMLRRLFAHLDQPEVRDNTLVIITSDHGEGLGNHDFVGHSLVAYDDLVRVPLIMRYPRSYPMGKRVDNPVSTRRIFHAALHAAGVDLNGNGSGRVPVDVGGLSLTQALNGSDPEGGVVYTEAYTPDTLIALMKSQTPAMIETFRCNQMRRAVYRDRYKLITVGDEPDELFDVVADPAELENLIRREPETAMTLDGLLTTFCADAETRRPANWEAAQLRLEEDEQLMSRLRGLGYVE